ncbi:N-acetylglucosamine-6-phosphate deacetylase [Rossellomorea aquimaris]|uniref:N-acetylglucosamine-6-phosphate deacetylase n=1 Tax=Rossellomorea aquimaris TaxID=189382 RepID=UPI0007D096C8|nr:N-acetylglucosamine-6-phosphate deacetylase [Rossellomorea aquimaris]
MHSDPLKLLLLNINIHTENSFIKEGYIKIETGIIVEIGEAGVLSSKEGFEIFSLPDGATAIPGMIDVHIHGVNGADTMDGSKEALDIMTQTLPKEGTTSFLATTMTEKETNIEKALINAAKYMNAHQKPGQAEILGVHLEGPFINRDMAGAQPIDSIKRPNVDLFKKWQELSGNSIKLVTLAPELDQNHELIRYLATHDIIASVGHSNATFDQVSTSISAGVQHVTHLYNQMSGFHHREPGIVGAAFLQKELMVELIADGVHVSPEAVKIACNQISDQRILLITDSMRAKCLKDGQYELGGQTVTVGNGGAYLNESTLAGSVLKMIDAFKNIQAFTDCSIKSAIKMTSENPAKQLNIFDRKGSLEAEKDADIVILDEELEVYMTICRGRIAYIKQEE